jgi:hypothetical protein
MSHVEHMSYVGDNEATTPKVQRASQSTLVTLVRQVLPWGHRDVTRVVAVAPLLFSNG